MSNWTPAAMWGHWIANPKIFDYALRNYPEVVARYIRDCPELFAQFREAHPHVFYSEEVQARRIAEWDARPCGSIIRTLGKPSRERGNIVFSSPERVHGASGPAPDEPIPDNAEMAAVRSAWQEGDGAGGIVRDFPMKPRRLIAKRDAIRRRRA